VLFSSPDTRPPAADPRDNHQRLEARQQAPPHVNADQA
jgi:hypothetical protein